MTPALTPELALDYLRELSTDIRAGVVLAADGTLLAGPADLAELAREFGALTPDATGIEVVEPGSGVYLERSKRFVLVVVCGRFALPALVRHDLRAVLADLEGERSIRPQAA